jgi:hypothetical protein
MDASIKRRTAPKRKPTFGVEIGSLQNTRLCALLIFRRLPIPPVYSAGAGRLCVDQKVPIANTAATVEHSGEFEEPE